MTHFVRGEMATAAGDKALAASEMEAFAAAYADPAISANYPGYVCLLAPAEEAAGHPDKADAALQAGGHYIDCYRFRGDILDGRGDWAGARRAYAAAIAIAPDLPAAYYSFGLALARHGDLEGAKRQASAGPRQRGPHWADPLEAWATSSPARAAIPRRSISTMKPSPSPPPGPPSATNATRRPWRSCNSGDTILIACLSFAPTAVL